MLRGYAFPDAEFRDLMGDDATDHCATNHAHDGAGACGSSDAGAEQGASGQAEQQCRSRRIHRESPDGVQFEPLPDNKPSIPKMRSNGLFAMARLHADQLLSQLPRTKLFLRFVLGEVIRFLNSAGQHVAFARNGNKLVVCQFRPLLLDASLDLFPVSFDTSPIHAGHLFVRLKFSPPPGSKLIDAILRTWLFCIVRCGRYYAMNTIIRFP
jgi:hypothetical protein